MKAGTRPHIIKFRVFWFSEETGRMVQWLTLRLPPYKMKCPSLRKMTRNEEFFGEFDSRRARFFSVFFSAHFFFHFFERGFRLSPSATLPSSFLKADNFFFHVFILPPKFYLSILPGLLYGNEGGGFWCPTSTVAASVELRWQCQKKSIIKSEYRGRVQTWADPYRADCREIGRVRRLCGWDTGKDGRLEVRKQSNIPPYRSFHSCYAHAPKKEKTSTDTWAPLRFLMVRKWTKSKPRLNSCLLLTSWCMIPWATKGRFRIHHWNQVPPAFLAHGLYRLRPIWHTDLSNRIKGAFVRTTAVHTNRFWIRPEINPSTLGEVYLFARTYCAVSNLSVMGGITFNLCTTTVKGPIKKVTSLSLTGCLLH